MNTIKVGDVILGEGKPKVCVPITGRTEEEIRLHTAEALDSGADLAEWRADGYDGVFDEESLFKTLDVLKKSLGRMPLLVTFRTKAEGGEREAGVSEYETFLKNVISSGKADLIDVELFMGEELLREICETAHRRGIFVVASSHDFSATPSEDEMIRRLAEMQECGADLLKLAVMPRSDADVLRLLSATVRMRDELATRPLITMSMGSRGMISRLAGEVFGSALTFGCAGTASAPGQIDAAELRSVLDIIHKNM